MAAEPMVILRITLPNPGVASPTFGTGGGELLSDDKNWLAGSPEPRFVDQDEITIAQGSLAASRLEISPGMRARPGMGAALQHKNLFVLRTGVHRVLLASQAFLCKAESELPPQLNISDAAHLLPDHNPGDHFPMPANITVK